MTPASGTPADGKTRILYCEANTDGTIGGSYYSLLYLIEGLKGTEFEAVAVFHREHRLLARFAEVCSQVRVLRTRPPVRLLRGTPRPSGIRSMLTWPLLAVQRALNFGRFLQTIVDCATMLRHERIALVHLNNSVTRSHEWMLAARLTKTACIVHERGINERYSFITRILARRLAAVICISGAVRAKLLEKNVTQRNLEVIHNGLDPARFAPGVGAEDLRRTLGIAAERRVIGMVGNIKEWKGQEVLVRALPAVAASVPNVLCLFVGATAESDREYAERLRQLVTDLGLKEHVAFLGAHEIVADALNLMEVAIHASIAPEPFGRVLLEAMAMKKPVVGSLGGAVPEIVEHGITGYTFEPGDFKALAGHVTELLLDPGRAQAFGEAGYARLMHRFHVSRNVDLTLSLYRRVVDGVSGRRN